MGVLGFLLVIFALVIAFYALNKTFSGFYRSQKNDARLKDWMDKNGLK